ncbi:MAG: hypothetical protein ABDH16_06325 [Thermodesulfovibrionaceae bacterium]
MKKKQNDYYIVKNSERKVYPILISSYWISSTSLREMIRNRKSIRYLVPEEVRQYIEKNQLYKEI